MSKFSKYLKKARFMNFMRQEDVANLIDANVSVIGAYETDGRNPKLEAKVELARKLNVDPVAMSGIELTEDDEIRLLNKLLVKYADKIDINDDKKVIIELGEDFLDFAEQINKYNHKVSEIIKDETRDSRTKEVRLNDYLNILDLYLETWPSYDIRRKLKNECKANMDRDEYINELRYQYGIASGMYISSLKNNIVSRDITSRGCLYVDHLDEHNMFLFSFPDAKSDE